MLNSWAPKWISDIYHNHFTRDHFAWTLLFSPFSALLRLTWQSSSKIFPAKRDVWSLENSSKNLEAQWMNCLKVMSIKMILAIMRDLWKLSFLRSLYFPVPGLIMLLHFYDHDYDNIFKIFSDLSLLAIHHFLSLVQPFVLFTAIIGLAKSGVCAFENSCNYLVIHCESQLYLFGSFQLYMLEFLELR